MLKICLNKNTTDQTIINHFKIDEIILMENAAINLSKEIKKLAKKLERKNTKPTITFLIGPGKNGADGLACARALSVILKNKITLIFLCDKKNINTFLKADLAKKHFEILKALNIASLKFNNFEDLKTLNKSDILIDCIIGSGARTNADESILPSFISTKLIDLFKQSRAFKVACDIPTMSTQNIFKVDLTLCIAALSLEHFKKDTVGRVKILPLGIANKKYQSCFKSDFYLLDSKILKEIFKRKEQRVNKGSFGSVFIIEGRMQGASLISAKAALNCGCGKVIICKNFGNFKEGQGPAIFDKEIIYMQENIKNARVLALGMGLGFSGEELKELFNFLNDFRGDLVLDADLFHTAELVEFLKLKSQESQKNLENNKNNLQRIILTPHLKELLIFLKNLRPKQINPSLYNDISSLEKNKFIVAKMLAKIFPDIVFLIKDYTMIIAQNNHIFINPYAKNNLAKGGSGDILSGLVAGFLAQSANFTKYSDAKNTALSCAKKASLMLALCSCKARTKYAIFGLTPNKIIKILSKLKASDIKALKF